MLCSIEVSWKSSKTQLHRKHSRNVSDILAQYTDSFEPAVFRPVLQKCCYLLRTQEKYLSSCSQAAKPTPILFFISLLLACHSSNETALRIDIDRIIGDLPQEQWSLETHYPFSHVGAVINETSRLFTGLPFLPKLHLRHTPSKTGEKQLYDLLNSTVSVINPYSYGMSLQLSGSIPERSNRRIIRSAHIRLRRKSIVKGELQVVDLMPSRSSIIHTSSITLKLKMNHFTKQIEIPSDQPLLVPLLHPRQRLRRARLDLASY